MEFGDVTPLVRTIVPPAIDRHRTTTPFREYVLKVHGRCNLACDYCYMYELADRSARTGATVMERRVFERSCQRIAEHVHAHGLSMARVVLHGGEPLLVGADSLARMADRLRAAVSPARLEVTVQTNAVLLDAAALDTLADAGVRIGVSLDGDRRANDRHRRYASGRSSFAAVDRALRLLRGRPDVFAGILCVVDLANDPLDCYEALLSYDPPMIDFLLPHANWSAPPPGQERGGAPYGEWLVAAFDRWYDAPVRQTGVRIFEEIINLLLGGQSRTESVGLSPVAVIVINVDGSYEQVDTLRSTFPGAVRTGFDVFTDSLDRALAHPAIAARQAGLAGLAASCRACPVHRVCGGGNYPHRYRAETGFANPSVYCADLRLLIEHVAARLRGDLAALRGART